MAASPTDRRFASLEVNGVSFAAWAMHGIPAHSGAEGALLATYAQTPALCAENPGLQVDLALENVSASPIEVLWGLSFEIPAAFSAGARIEPDATSYFDPREDPMVRMRWPGLYGDDFSRLPERGARTAYITDFGVGRVRVINERLQTSVELRWDATRFPYCWMEPTEAGVAFRPCSGLPEALKEGHGVVTLKPAQKIESRFDIVALRAN